ncbi:hypothetical protein D0T60_06175 [Bacteroides sp. 224]|nr:hypothetical protein [Bacteroides sp. 224]
MIDKILFLNRLSMSSVHYTNDMEQIHDSLMMVVSYLPYLLMGVLLLIIASLLFHLYEMNFSKEENVFRFIRSFLGDCIFLMLVLMLLLFLY